MTGPELQPEQRRPMIPLERMPVEQMLGCIEPFVASPPVALHSLAQSCERIHVSAGTTLIRAGQLGVSAFVVLRGRVNLVRAGEGGRDIILSSLGPGELCGEASIVTGAASSSSAISGSAVEVCRIPAHALIAHLESHPATSLRMLRCMQHRLADVESVASGLALCDVEQRLRRTLSSLARRQGRQTDGSEDWVLAPVPTQSELARMVGSCRETVSRTLTSMAKSGLLNTSRRKMILSGQLVEQAAV